MKDEEVVMCLKGAVQVTALVIAWQNGWEVFLVVWLLIVSQNLNSDE